MTTPADFVDPFEPFESPAPAKPKRARKPRKPAATATQYDMGKPVRSYELGKKPTFTAPFNVVVPNNWIDKQGEEQTSWTVVGAAWPTENGRGWSIKLRGGISVSGAIYLFPNDREKE
jgi:hypothetical protein